MNKKLLFLSSIIALFIIFCLSNTSYAGTQKWNSLDFNAKLNDDGSMNVTETWDIYINETNTLFKDYELDYNKFSGITDVKVELIENNKTIPLEEIYEEQYHVDSGCYYGMILPSNSSKFEIAWNVGLDNSSANRVYRISYKVLDVVKVYNDCTEVYWQFLGRDNRMEGNNITGTITLPKSVSNIEKLRVWAHGNLTGDIQKVSSDTVQFNLPKITSNEMLEVRVVTDENIYLENKNIYNYNKLDSIIAEETRWADEANHEREMAKTKLLIYEVIYGGWASMGKVVKSDIFYSKLRKNPVKKTAVFCVGAATVDEPNMKAAMKKIVPDDLKGSIKTFYCPGGLNYEKMGLSGKLMMKAFASMLKKDEDKKEQGEMYSHSFDISDKKYIKPIVEWARA